MRQQFQLIFCCFLVIFFLFTASGCTNPAPQELEIKQGSCIVFIGNTFAERQQLFGHFETFLHSKFPSQQLKIRNMAWPADEVALQPRPAGFGEMHIHLQKEKADIIFASYGFNESFKGKEGLTEFSINLKDWMTSLKTHHYNGKEPPQIVLISPIAHEALENLSDGVNRNKELQLYTDAMRAVADDMGILFVNLFSPTKAYAISDETRKLTINGVHLSNYGDWRVSHMMAESLFGIDTLSESPKESIQSDVVLKLKRMIYDKNYTYLQHWRGANMEYVYGSRNKAGGATGVPEERAQIENIVNQFDKKIWEQSKPKPETIWKAFPLNKSPWPSTPEYTDIEIPDDLIPNATAQLEGDEKEGMILGIEKALQAFHLPKGYKIELFASEQDFPLANPMAMNFDSQGRLWVANTPTWPQSKPGVQPGDFIVILEDENKDGKADKHTIFMENLNMIHGFALGFDGVYISQTPNIIYAKDTDGDDRADSYTTILQGFGAEDAEHSINNLTWGPDGGLYFLNGIFFHSQIETPYGPARILDSGVFRYEPRLQKLDPYLSHFFWNPWGLAFDETGQGLLLDASSGDFYHMAPMASNFTYPKVKYSCCSPNDGPKDHPIHELLSFAPEGVGPAAGIGIIQNSHFPKEAQGRFISNQIEGWRGTHWFDFKEKGSTFEVKSLEEELIFSEDPHFRPVAMTFGPDGALYILDFYSPIFENVEFPKRTKGRDHSHGRVWRVTYPSRPLLEYPKFDTASTEELLDLLKRPEAPLRYYARRELQERSTESVLPKVVEWMADQDPLHPQFDMYMLEALFIYEGHHVIHENLILNLLESRSDQIRAGTTRILRYWQGGMDNSDELLTKLVNDKNIRVRLEAVIALGHSSSPSAYDIVIQALNHPLDDGMKHALEQTLNYLKGKKSLKITSTNLLLELPLGEKVAKELLIRNDGQITESKRLAALSFLKEFNKSSISSEILKLLPELDRSSETESGENHAVDDLKVILLACDQKELDDLQKELDGLSDTMKSPDIRALIYLALVKAGKNAREIGAKAARSETVLARFIESIPLLGNQGKKILYPLVEAKVESNSGKLREVAIRVLSEITIDKKKTIHILQSIAHDVLEDIPIRFAALDGLSKLPGQQKEEGVIKIKMGVVPSKMEFDKKEFTVPAGAAVEITFTNNGFQQHNMLICAPGQMEVVAKAAEAMIAQLDGLDKHYIPDIKEVLFSIPMISAKKSYTLQFFAPDNPGEYPYVCTFPGHWRMMNGRMLVL